MDKIERRFAGRRTLRFDRSGSKSGSVGTAVGYAAVFFDGTPESEYELAPGLRERIMPGTFDRVIRERQDVRGLFNHQPNLVLGRVTSGTLRLSVDRQGLAYEIDLPDTQTGRDLATSIERGDINGSSFSFQMRAQKFVVNPGNDDIREVHDVDVFDVGPVTFPAYAATTAGIRTGELISEVRTAWDAARGRRSPETRPQPPSLPTMRRRLVRVEREVSGAAEHCRMRAQLAALDAADSRDGRRRLLDAVDTELARPLDRSLPVSPAMAADVQRIRARIDTYGF